MLQFDLFFFVRGLPALVSFFGGDKRSPFFFSNQAIACVCDMISIYVKRHWAMGTYNLFSSVEDSGLAYVNELLADDVL